MSARRGQAGARRRWTEAEYAILFGRFPPRGSRPSRTDCAELGNVLNRSADAIDWQWTDGASYCGGRSASTTSDALKSWLDRTGACR